jgi:hypothetical protein
MNAADDSAIGPIVEAIRPSGPFSIIAPRCDRIHGLTITDWQPIGSYTCDACGVEFSDAVPCCCDHATYPDDSHDEGYCGACCRGNHSSRPSPTYERMDCDQ